MPFFFVVLFTGFRGLELKQRLEPLEMIRLNPETAKRGRGRKDGSDTKGAEGEGDAGFIAGQQRRCDERSI